MYENTNTKVREWRQMIRGVQLSALFSCYPTFLDLSS